MKEKYNSMVCYCTTEYIKNVLDTLVKSGTIQNYWFCTHQPEGNSTKVHTHIYFTGLRTRVQPSDVQNQFHQIVDGEDKPRGANLNPRDDTNIDGAILYSFHDPYFICEHLKDAREFYYTENDVVTSFDSDYWHRLVSEARDNIKRSDALGDVPDDSLITSAYAMASSGDFEGAYMLIAMKAPKYSKQYIFSLNLLLKLHGKLNAYMADALCTFMRSNQLLVDSVPFDNSPELVECRKKVL